MLRAIRQAFHYEMIQVVKEGFQEEVALETEQYREFYTSENDNSEYRITLNTNGEVSISNYLHLRGQNLVRSVVVYGLQLLIGKAYLHAAAEEVTPS